MLIEHIVEIKISKLILGLFGIIFKLCYLVKTLSLSFLVARNDFMIALNIAFKFLGLVLGLLGLPIIDGLVLRIALKIFKALRTPKNLPL